ncbi:tyrosine-protein phosphatase [uncultured Amnibacterium sp.]|uniref:tyrosine-protein phosphatase n=1 Tax=uncultured Amnibacterium sp. TaxID=1631851 RepID=UPI0035CB9E0F
MPLPPDRSLGLPSIWNARDVGGYRAEGGTVRFGRLLRSSAPLGLGQEEVAALRQLPVGVVVDLRDELERSFAPTGLDALGVPVSHLPLLSKPTVEFIAADASLDDLYDDIVLIGGANLVAAIGAIPSGAPGAALVHCTAGKDRTGLVVALALLLVGVDRADVLADYAESELHLPAAALDEIVVRLRAEHTTAGANLDALVRTSPPAALAGVLDRIDERFGTVATYAESWGLDAAAVARLRAFLVQDDEGPASAG